MELCESENDREDNQCEQALIFSVCATIQTALKVYNYNKQQCLCFLNRLVSQYISMNINRHKYIFRHFWHICSILHLHSSLLPLL